MQPWTLQTMMSAVNPPKTLHGEWQNKQVSDSDNDGLAVTVPGTVKSHSRQPATTMHKTFCRTIISPQVITQFFLNFGNF